MPEVGCQMADRQEASGGRLGGLVPRADWMTTDCQRANWDGRELAEVSCVAESRGQFQPSLLATARFGEWPRRGARRHEKSRVLQVNDVTASLSFRERLGERSTYLVAARSPVMH
jgi:hypothetical protein